MTMKPITLLFFAVFAQAEIPSIYTEVIKDWIAHWPPAFVTQSDSQPGSPLRLKCIKSEDSSSYVGLQQQMVVEASLARMAEVIEDFDSYSKIFPNFKDVHVIQKEGNTITTSWEQIVPIVDNILYVMKYEIDKKKPDQWVYRYQLISSNRIKFSDGVIVIEKNANQPGKILYTEYDFFDANYGALKFFFRDRIWRESLEGIFLSDLGLKLRAEKPQMTTDAIKENAQKLLDQYPMKPVLENCVDYQRLISPPK